MLLPKVFQKGPKEKETVELKCNDQKVVTSTIVELCEPLLDSDDAKA